MISAASSRAHRAPAGAVALPLARAQRAEDAADLPQGTPAPLGHRDQARLGLGRVGIDDVRADARLQRDHAERVPDDVVQLLGDAQALVGHGAAGLLEPRALGQLGAVREQCDGPPALGDPPPERDGSAEDHGVRQQLPEGHDVRVHQQERDEDDEHPPGREHRPPAARPGCDGVRGEERRGADHRRRVAEGDDGEHRDRRDDQDRQGRPTAQHVRGCGRRDEGDVRGIRGAGLGTDGC